MSNPNGAPGLFTKTDINGYDCTADITTVGVDHKYTDNKTVPNNTGYEQHRAGGLIPGITLNGYKRHNLNAVSAWELLRQASLGSAGDIEFIGTEYYGYGASPAAGDYCSLWDGTLITGPTGDAKPDQLMMLPATFQPRGVNWAIGQLLMDYMGKGTNVGTPVDTGAYGAGLAFGAVLHLQVLTNTGVAATGTITISAQPSDADTVTIGGQLFTFKTTPTTAGHVKIAASGLAQDTANNLWAAATGAANPSGSAYFPGTTKAPTTAVYSLPASGVITVTYATTGTGGNSFTLAKSSTNIAVSGATLSGGTAGETLTGTIASATSQGGSYTPFATFTSDGTVRKAERIQIARGTTINRWWKATATMSGSTMTIALRIAGGRNWF